jgi:DNA processing protein
MVALAPFLEVETTNRGDTATGDAITIDAARLGRRSPATLFAAGDRRLLDAPAVAVVGTRAPSAEGLAHARAIAAALARGGFVVLSGLAFGVDAAAHRAALAAGGRTIAVIGTPLERVYPAAHAALQAVIARDHLVLSPFARGSAVTRGNFPQRDLVLAALALAVVVVEADDGSGTLHTANEAVRLGRLLLVAPPVRAARLRASASAHAVACSDDVVCAVQQNVARARKGLLPGASSH